MKKKILTSLPSIFLQDYFCLAFTSLVNADFKEGISLDNKGNDWTSSDRGMELLINGSKEVQEEIEDNEEMEDNEEIEEFDANKI